jgi:hypothetical protein
MRTRVATIHTAQRYLPQGACAATGPCRPTLLTPPRYFMHLAGIAQKQEADEQAAAVVPRPLIAPVETDEERRARQAAEKAMADPKVRADGLGRGGGFCGRGSRRSLTSHSPLILQPPRPPPTPPPFLPLTLHRPSVPNLPTPTPTHPRPQTQSSTRSGLRPSPPCSPWVSLSGGAGPWRNGRWGGQEPKKLLATQHHTNTQQESVPVPERGLRNGGWGEGGEDIGVVWWWCAMVCGRKSRPGA